MVKVTRHDAHIGMKPILLLGLSGANKISRRAVVGIWARSKRAICIACYNLGTYCRHFHVKVGGLLPIDPDSRS